VQHAWLHDACGALRFRSRLSNHQGTKYDEAAGDEGAGWRRDGNKGHGNHEDSRRTHQAPAAWILLLVFFATGNLIYFSFKWYSTDLYRSLHEPTPCFFELTYVVCISLTGAFTFAVFGITRENYTELKVKLNVFARLLVDIFDDCRWLMRNL
jgi:hypothetical protein